MTIAAEDGPFSCTDEELSLLWLLFAASLPCMAALITWSLGKACVGKAFPLQRKDAAECGGHIRKTSFLIPLALDTFSTTPPRRRSVSFRLLDETQSQPPLHFEQRAWGDEVLNDRRLRPLHAQLKQHALGWMERRRRGLKRKISGAKGKLQLVPGRGDGLQSLFAPTALSADSDLGSSGGGAGGGSDAGGAGRGTPRSPGRLSVAKGEEFGLNDDARIAFNALTELEVFGAEQVPVLLDLCRRASCVDLRAGQDLLRQGEPIDSLLVLRSGTCEAYVAQRRLDGLDCATGGGVDTGFGAGDGGAGDDDGGGDDGNGKAWGVGEGCDSAGSRSAEGCGAEAPNPAAAAGTGAAAAGAGTVNLMTVSAPGSLLMSLLDIAALMTEERPACHVGIRCLENCSFVRIPRSGDLFRLAAPRSRSSPRPTCDTTLSAVLRVLLARINRVTLLTGFLYLGLVHDLRPVAGKGGGGSDGGSRGGSGGTDDSGSSGSLGAETTGSGSSGASRASAGGGDAGGGGGSAAEHAASAAESLLAATTGRQGNQSMAAIRRVVGDALGLYDCVHLPRIEVLPLAPAASPRGNWNGGGSGNGGSRGACGTDSAAAATGPTAVRPLASPVGLAAAPSGRRPPALSFSERGRLGSQDMPGLESPPPLQLVPLRAGQQLLSPDDAPCCYVVVRGFLRAMVSLERLGLFGGDGVAPAEYARYGPGSVVGQLSLLTGSTQDWYGCSSGNSTPMLTVTAADSTGGASGGSGTGVNAATASASAGKPPVPAAVVVRITRAAHEAILRSNPELAAAMARRLVTSTPPLLRVFDFGIRYLPVRPGQVVVRQGQHFDACLYVVLHGRLRAAVDVQARGGGGSGGGGSGGVGTGNGDGGNGGDVASDNGGGGNGEGGADRPPNSPRRRPALEVLAEYGRGMLIGESEVITREASWATVQAVRHSSLARVPTSMLSFLAARHPSVIAYLAKHASDKRYRTLELLADGPDRCAHGGRPKTIMVLPVSGSTPLDLFTSTLKTALQNTGSTAKVLTSGLVASGLGLDVDSYEASGHDHDYGVGVGIGIGGGGYGGYGDGGGGCYGSDNDGAGRNGFGGGGGGSGRNGDGVSGCDGGSGGGGSGSGSIGGHYDDDGGGGGGGSAAAPAVATLSLAVGGWLAQQEERFDVVLYACDWHFGSSWNRLCAAQADRVLLVGNANDGPELSSLERELDLSRTCPSAQISLVLLHVDPSPWHVPTETKAWITRRNGINGHFHLRLHSRDLAYDCWHHKSDFLRLARCLTGKAVGLVLGGGGARGMAHVGVLRALEEEGVPVDLVCGTSQGALVGGLYARTDSYLEILPRAHAFARRMGSRWNYLWDLTLPVTSYFTGIGFNTGVSEAVGAETKIEDLWLSYYCVTTDLTTSRQRTHRNGTMWRYVRASMSLAGYLPPMCERDPVTGRVHYLCDGGYVNNLPADLMRLGVGTGLGAGVVISVDVGSEWDFAFDSFGDRLNGFSVLLRRLWPWGIKTKVPSMADISEQLAYISSVRQLEEARSKSDLYLRPPIASFATLDFHRYAEIEAIGYNYARPLLRAFKRRTAGDGSGPLPELLDLRRARSAGAFN